MLENQEREGKKRSSFFFVEEGGRQKGLDEPPAVPSATWVVPEQPKEVVSEGPSGKP